MRIRTIKPEFWHSPHQAELDWPHKVLFLGLLNLADDEGRALADPRYIKGQLLPYEEVTAVEVDELLVHLHRVGLVELYDHAGRRHLCITNFSKHQSIDRPKASKLPDPKGPGSTAFDDTSTNDRRHVDDASTTDRRAIADASLLEQGTGNREQGRDKPSSSSSETTLDDGEADDDVELRHIDTLRMAEVVTLHRTQGTTLEQASPEKTPPTPLIEVEVEHQAVETAVVSSQQSYADDFERFWENYPKKVGKGEAFRVWRKMRAGERAASLQAIVDQTEHWERQQRERQFIPNPATWLRQGRWDDDPATDIRQASPSRKPAGWGALERMNQHLQAQKGIAR